MNYLENKFENILDRFAKVNMLQWRLSFFKQTHPRLFRTFMSSMEHLHLNPIDESKCITVKVKILKHCLWFASDEIVTYNKLEEFYTSKSIKLLIKSKYIEVVEADIIS